MAKEGMKLTSFYAGSTVCAPSRSVLMTGQDAGHTWVRGNGAASTQTLRPEDVTVAEKLKEAGYATALCGKWGLGDDATGGRTGLPRKQGFDYFYGYLNQVHAHNYYPEFLWRNETKHTLRNVVTRTPRRYGGFAGGYAVRRIDYSHDLVANEAIQFINVNAAKKEPFFLYCLLYTSPSPRDRTRSRMPSSA